MNTQTRERSAVTRTLVVHVGGIGDLLLACPAIAWLAEDGPVEAVGQVERVTLAVAGGLAEAAHSLEAVEFESILSSPSERLRAFLSRFDRAVIWMKDDGHLARAVENCGVRDVRVFPGLPPKPWSSHASYYYLSCVKYAGATAPRPLLLRGLLSRKESSTPAYDVVIHPGSGGKLKNWPFAYFRELAHRLEEQGRRVAWSLGPAEEEIRLPDGAEHVPQGSLVDLAHVLAAARLYVGNDSGVTHLAAAVGCRTVTIFGATDPQVWAPLGEHVRVLQGAPCPSVEDALAAI